MGDTWKNHGFLRAGRWATLMGMIAVTALAVLPSSASAAACPVVPGNSTAWIGGSGSFNDDLNWSNGGPSAACDVSITAGGTYTVSMTGGASMKSLALGGVGSSPTLEISAANVNTNLNANTTGVSIASGAAIVLTCPGGGCNGGAAGGPGLNAGGSTITNAGSITVAAAAGTGTTISGGITNTGTMQFNQSATMNNGTVLNQSTLNIATEKVLTSTTSHCGDSTGSIVKNDTGGTINAAGSGTLSVINYEQGNGSTTGTLPVQLPCGSLKYTGNGASVVQANGGFSLSGAMQAGQSLTVNAASSNTNASLTSNFTNNGSIALTCPALPTDCSGGPTGGAGFNAAGNTFTNAGTFTVAAASGTGAGLSSGGGGTITNTGTMQFNQSAALSGVVVNEGPLNIATGKTVTSSGSSCGDTGGSVKNDTGGQINATGTGTFNISTNYEQGNGTTTGPSPVNMPCGSLKYSGNGASKVQVNGGFTLTGEMQSGQSLIVSAASSNTNANLGGDFTNKGSITLTCPGGGCSGGSGGGAGFNVSNKDFVNAGTFTVAAASGTGAGVGANFEGTITNTGTMQFDQSAGLGGPVVNKGPINIANGVTVGSHGSSCGEAGGNIKNDTGGHINAAGTGTLSTSTNFEQGAGTTSGIAPVTLNCGVLKYVGSGASTVRANAGTMTGNIASGQTLVIPGGINAPPSFTNAGTIMLDQSLGNSTLNVGTTLTNTGTIMTSGPSANTSSIGGGGTIDQTGASAKVVVPAGTNFNIGGSPLLLKAGQLTGSGTLTGSVNNSGGVVAPGASPGTLTLSGNYTQSASGRLDIEVNGTAAGQFDKLAVGGSVTLGGTLALQPSAGYAASAAVGDSVGFLTYGGTRTNPFAQTTVNPSMACPKQLGASYSDGAKAVNAVVTSSGASCGGGNGGGGGGGGGVITDPPPPALPNTTLGTHPPGKVKTKKSKAKVSFAFSSDLAGVKFECKLDKKSFKPCKSPKSYKVKPGKHKFSVRAVAGGVADPTPASFSFKVVREKR